MISGSVDTQIPEGILTERHQEPAIRMGVFSPTIFLGHPKIPSPGCSAPEDDEFSGPRSPTADGFLHGRLPDDCTLAIKRFWTFFLEDGENDHEVSSIVFDELDVSKRFGTRG
jgi:hypothetical protein